MPPILWLNTEYGSHKKEHGSNPTLIHRRKKIELFDVTIHQDFLKFEAVLAHREERVPTGTLSAAMEYGCDR